MHDRAVPSAGFREAPRARATRLLTSPLGWTAESRQGTTPRGQTRRIVPFLESIPSLKADLNLRTGSNRGMQLEITWDEEKLGLPRAECERQLREGEPPITVLGGFYNPYVIRPRELEAGRSANGKGRPITVYVFGLKDGEEIIVGERLREILQRAAARS